MTACTYYCVRASVSTAYTMQNTCIDLYIDLYGITACAYYRICGSVSFDTHTHTAFLCICVYHLH